MNFSEILRTSFKNVMSNKIRTLLTMLGIVIGISSVIIISSVSAGSQSQVDEQFSELGSGNITVGLNSFRGVEDEYLLDEEEYFAISRLFFVKYASPVTSFSTEVKLLDRTQKNTAELTGVNQDYQYYENPEMLYGRYISAEDVATSSNVAVITNTTALKVFGEASENVIGEEIYFDTWRGNTKYTVIGMTYNDNTEEEMLYPFEYNESITVPYTSIEKLTYSDTYSQIAVVVDEADSETDFSTLITNTLNNLHEETGYYRVQNLMDIAENLNSVTSTIATLVMFVAAISLLVGGVGVMNIMLVTVTERTREIGIRRAIGAKKKDILIQFILEALTLTAIGGILGILIGILGGKIVGDIMGTGSVTSASTVLLAVSVSTLCGIIFGVYPANKAANLNTIDALRYN
ncbi:MAG: ABC transporter permease [Lachnospirales bacterium]